MQENGNHLNILTTVLEHAYEGIVVVDQQGVITHFNQAYSRLKGISQQQAIGQNVTDVIENTRLHHVLKTGVPERGRLQTISGQDMIVHRIPVWEGETVTSAIGILVFDGVSDLYEILEQIESKEHTSTASAPSVNRGKQPTERTNFDTIIGRSEAIMNTKRIARKAAKTLATVQITGESGTGKELFAQAIHDQSPYADGEFISINCAAIPEHLLEAELFGYEEGAFTGAKKGGKPGLFEAADYGTLFLDEIGDMPLSMQSKILRVLQEKEATRVGGLTPYQTHVRIISATNKNLISMIEEERFREDLYYRLNIIPIHIPPLRARKEDIPLLLATFLENVCRKYEIEEKHFLAESISILTHYPWPGNIREMMNMIEQLVSLVDEECITPDKLPAKILTENSTVLESRSSAFSFLEKIQQKKQDHEKELLITALKDANGNKAEAARQIGIHRSTLYEKLKKFDIL
ncbi:sigma-54 interaction domain-containing protein [Salisediminibacterium beveridgei]|nr:sigma 54-interacting transcriptional regulator [Salisediminibacterium beveridgei]